MNETSRRNDAFIVGLVNNENKSVKWLIIASKYNNARYRKYGYRLRIVLNCLRATEESSNISTFTRINLCLM